jgi:hypothetical protein
MAELQDASYILGRLNDCLVLEHVGDDGVADGAASRVGLSGEEGLVGWEGEESEDGEVGVDGCEEEGEEVLDRGGVVQVGRVRVLLHLGLGEREDLVDVLELVGVAREGEVNERDEKARDILY